MTDPIAVSDPGWPRETRTLVDDLIFWGGCVFLVAFTLIGFILAA